MSGASATAADLEIAASGAAAAAETAARLEAEAEVERTEAERVAAAELAAATIVAERNELLERIGGMQTWLANQLETLSGGLLNAVTTMMERLQGLESLILALPQVTAEILEEEIMQEEPTEPEPESVTSETVPESGQADGSEPERQESEPAVPAATRARVRPRF